MARQPRQPFLPLFFGDFLASTSEWEGEERGLYLLLMGYQWTLGSLPPEPRKLCKLVGWDWELFERCWVTVSEKFEYADVIARAMKTDGERHQSANGRRLINRRLEEHRARISDLSGKNSESGKKGAAARWGREKGGVMANAIPEDGERHSERHQSANGVTDSIPTHPNPDLRDLSLSRAREPEAVPREAGEGAGRPMTVVESVYGSLLEDWKRDVPECNPEAFTKWIVHCELAGKQMTPNMRLMQARRLAGNGDAEAQAEVVDWCMEQGYRTLIPIADVRARRDGRVASGSRKPDPPKRTWEPPDDTEEPKRAQA